MSPVTRAMPTTRWLRAVTVGALAVLVLGACTGIPEDSTPQVVQTLQIEPQAPQVPLPQPGAPPRSIVVGFLSANVSDDPSHNGARQYLSPEAKTRWVDSTITVVDTPRVGNPDSKHQVNVSGNEIGTIDQYGVYTPALRGDGTGSGGINVSLPFAMKKIKGEWRIDNLQPGLIIGIGDFEQFTQRTVYFYDLTEQHLVPDPRYTQLTDPDALAEWLLARLIGSSGDVLRNAVTTELPAGSDAKRITVDVSRSPVRVAIPGAGRLDGGTRDRLAAQVAETLGKLTQVGQSGNIEITDGGAPVTVPVVGGSIFAATDFDSQITSAPSVPSLYYVQSGAVLDERGKPLPGRVGRGVYGLNSVALADRGGSSGLLVAGVRGSGTDAQLDIGTQDGGLTASKVHGQLSRPAWVPGQREVWIGDGTQLLRVATNGADQIVQVTAATGKATGQVIAVRLSPEGSRVALVLSNGAAGSQIWLGAVVRESSGKVRVDSLAPISPQGISVTDVAWNSEVKLFAIGRNLSSNAAGIYELQCDGSLWSPESTGNLPQAAQSITATAGAVASVSAGDSVWKQRSREVWVSPDGDETHGRNPVYAE